MYKWPLNTNNFSVSDRNKISKFILNPQNYWTQDKYVRKFEEKMRQFVGSEFAVYCSSGSTANTMLAMYLKDVGAKNEILFPSTTWTTTVAPFIREGFKPVFIDVDIQDLSIDLYKTENYLNAMSHKVGAVVIVSLLGIVPNIQKIMELKRKFPSIKFIMDNCENNFGTHERENISGLGLTSTTSTYFGHQIQSVEGGFVFTDNEETYNYCLMARNHGMVRSLPEWIKEDYENPQIDPRFDFSILGNNFRNTDINAFIGLLDLRKTNASIKYRIKAYERFASNLSSKYLVFANHNGSQNVMFCLPIILKEENFELINKAKDLCHKLSIETRPIISGNLLRQTCYRQYSDDYRLFGTSEFLNNNGFYVGLHTGVTFEQIDCLVESLNKL